ncbi:MAG TPA: hypothetical protein VGD99_03780 [Anaerolineae bacterium]
MRHKRFILIFICLFLLAMVGFACGILVPVPEVIASSPDSSELLQGGRDLTIADWADHLSLLLMVSLLTIIIDLASSMV